MSRKNKTLRAFLHQNQNPTIEQTWDAAWKHAQKTFHAMSMQDMEEKLAAAQAECERLRKDAERYRFARESVSRGKEDIVICKVLWRDNDRPTETIFLTEEEADAAIDAAMEKENKV